MPALRNKLVANLQVLTDIKMNTSTKLENAKLKALILDTVHQLSVVGELTDNNTGKLSDWSWFKQLRYHIVQPQGGGIGTQIKMLE